MEAYNYREAMKNDILDYIEYYIDFDDFNSIDDLSERLKSDLWLEDSVTGGDSGSYTSNAYQAEENLRHNLDLFEEALCEFGLDMDYQIEKGAEACDVIIRYYLLDECIAEALDEIEAETKLNIK